MDEVHAQIGTLAQQQHGLVAWDQALTLGLTPDAVKHLTASGRWVRVARGVYRINGTPLTWRGRMMAVCLAAGPGALISHRAAAALWTLDGFEPPRVIDLTVPRPRRPRLAGIRVHEVRHFDLVERTIRDEIPVTGIPQTILDLCATSRNPDIPLRALDDARRRRLVTWAELWECLDLQARRGRRGLRIYRGLLERRGGKEPTDSHFEALVQQLLVDAGLPEPQPRVWVVAGGQRYRLDLAYPDLRIDIECHSKDAHLNEAAFERDPVRDNALVLAGWIVLHFTWNRYQRDPAGIVAEVRRALRAR